MTGGSLFGDDPARVDRYRVLNRIGTGGMSVVYRAYDPQLDRAVALKLVTPGDSDLASRTRLLREARAMAQICHANVVPVFDVGEHGDAVYLTMELIDGPTLGDWVHETARPWTEILATYLGAGKGLAAAHRAGLVHRDFKPDNVLLAPDGRARVLDFGLARSVAIDDGDYLPADTHTEMQTPDSGTAMDQDITTTGLICGTPAYMSPEQHLGMAPGPLSDQFSFCVALWEALYQERPFAGSTPFAVADAITEGRLRPPPRRTRVPLWTQRILTRGLSRAPEERHEDMPSLLASIAFSFRILHG